MRTTTCVVTLVLLCLAWLASPGDGARILGVFPMPSRSHFILGTKLLKELAAKGHEVTMISSFPLKTPVKNYRDIPVDGLLKLVTRDLNLYEMSNMWVANQVLFTHLMGLNIANATLHEENVQKLIKSNEKFDLVIAENFMNEAHIGLAHRFNCPYVLLSTIGSSAWTNSFVANPAPYSYVPDLFLTYSSHMNFWQRLHSTYHGTAVQLFRKFYYLPKQQAVLEEYFKDAPPLEQMMNHNVSMILLNSHSVLNEPKPHVPAMVEIGGFHIDEPKPLPKDLQDYMDSAKDGVVLMSMGSNLQSSALPAHKRDAILKAFSKLKQKVIWKWEEDTLPGQPANVKLSKWLPQNDIMAHPNLRAFITHGGLLSTTEAIFHGVPVIGIPVFGDQRMNVANAADKGYGLAVPFDDLTEENLSSALDEIINKPKYRENIKLRSSILRDQPVKPIDSAVFWIEHVLRHKGAKHFRSAAMDLQWYELYLVDIAVAMFLKDVLIIFVIIFLVKKLCCKKKNTDEKKKKKQ